MSKPAAVAIPITPSSLNEAVSRLPQSDKSEVVIGDDLMNHLTYKATNGVPYIVDYFGVNEFYETNPTVTQMARELHELFVDDDSENQIHEMKDILDSLSQELNLQENDAPIYKLRKMLEMAKIKDRIATNDQNRNRMLADLNRM